MNRWRVLVLVLGVTAMSAPTVGQDASASHPALRVEELATLTDAQLIDRYLYFDRYLPAHAEPNPATQPDSPSRYHVFTRLRLEIKRRGAPLVPPLLEALRDDELLNRHVPTHRYSGFRWRHDSDVISLLVMIRDPRAVPALLDRFERRAGMPRHFECRAIQQLTYLAYYSNYSWRQASERPGAGPDTDQALKAGYGEFVGFYRNWLVAEGRDPATWLDLAIARARSHLASDDPMEVTRAASFLSARRDGKRDMRDDAPDQTVARLGQIVSNVEKGADGKWKYRGKPADMTTLLGTLSLYGAAARPYTGQVIQILGDDPPWNLLRAPASIGGTEAIDYLLTRLAKLDGQRQARGLADERARLHPPNQPRKDPKAEQLLAALATCRDGIDRWAGCVFETDAQRRAWWTDHRQRDPEQYLRQNLQQTAARADAGDVAARTIICQALPDSPWGRYDWEEMLIEGMMMSYVRPSEPEPAWQARRWLEEHNDRLRYDATTHTLRLAPPT
jgi:hypothetical protein